MDAAAGSRYLEIQNLSVAYGAQTVIKDLSISIRQGELFTILGPSGSGKSTLLHCVAGFLRPRAGHVLAAGEELTTLPPNRREIGMVFQQGLLFPHKTVFENIAYPLRIRGTSKSEVKDRVARWLNLLRLDGLQARKPRQLSGGQQQRVALARALVFSPRLLLLDEPLGALDKNLREEMQFEIRRIQLKTQTTVLYVTHDQKEAMAISDRIAVLNNGGIVQEGTPRSIYSEPINVFVAGFVGSANFLRTRILSVNTNFCKIELFGRIVGGLPKPHWSIKEDIGATLMVRPEHVQLSPLRSTPASGIACHVQERYFQGSFDVVKCRIDGYTQDVIAFLTREFSATGPLQMSIDPRHARLYPTVSSSSPREEALHV